MKTTIRMGWAALLAPLSDGEIRTLETALGTLEVHRTERVGDMVVHHGRNRLTGRPQSASRRAA